MQQLFEKYIQGKCTNDEYQQVLHFLQEPGNNNHITRLIEKYWKDTLNQGPEVEPNVLLLNQIHHQIALQEKNPLRIVRMYRVLLAAAGILIFGLLFTTLFKPSFRKEEIAFQKVYTPYGGKTNITLPDGSSVWINSGSELIYPVKFEQERVVELKGEAYFDVVKMKSPFLVKGNFGQVKVLGTQFNVKAYENEPFQTTLVSGLVTFRTKNGNEQELQPGTQIYQDNEKFRIRTVETELITSWKEGKLIFRDEPLINMISQLERWYNVQIELKSQKLKNLRFT